MAFCSNCDTELAKTLDIIVSNKTKSAWKRQMEEATFDEIALFLTAMEDD